MKTPNLSEIKKALPHCTQDQLIELILRLARHKIENKELLAYLLFDSENESLFVAKVKQQTSDAFEAINTSSYFLMRKSVRKQLKDIKKYIKFSRQKSTEIELLLHFLAEMLQLRPSIVKDKRLNNIYERNLIAIDQKINNVHEDLQYDYQQQRKDL